MKNCTLIAACPITGSTNKITYFDLGNFPLVNNLHDTREESLNCDRYPLHVNYYPESGLSALSVSIDANLLFKNYSFLSEVNIPYLTHCQYMFTYIQELTSLSTDDLVIDIGGNDGSLLSEFKKKSRIDLQYLNIDPSENLHKLSEDKGIPVLCEFFSLEVAKKLNRKAKVITSTNVFQHLQDINSFVKGVYELMNLDSIWVLEFPYWIHDLETKQFDQIYHEHLYYYSITSLQKMMDKHNLQIVRADKQAIHGGTMRVVIVKKESLLQKDFLVEHIKSTELRYTEDYYKNWGAGIWNHLKQCKKTILDLKSRGFKIACFGAAAKGCIFLNSIGITHKEIEYIIDDTKLKQDKYMPGTGIKIVSREELKDNHVDYILILAHNFSDYIIQSLRTEYTGKFLLMLPTIQVR